MSDREEETGKLAIQLANAIVFPMVLKSAIELNIIDLISEATTASGGIGLSPSEIALRIPTKNPDAPLLIDRMLRLLASYDVVKYSQRNESDGGVMSIYSAAPVCKFLTKNEDGGSVAPLLLLHHDEVFTKSWYHLNDVILEGGIPFQKAYGMKAIQYQSTDPRFNGVFNRAMSNHSSLIMEKILDIYNGFDGINVLVDVGGGTGATLSAIISKYPHIKGINFDFPHVLAQAPAYPGVEHVGGDMFVSVPKADAIFMKWILHGYSDEQCLKSLRKCWEALPDDGKLIVVESILPETPENKVSSHIVFEQDLFMLAQTPGGRERTQREYEALAKSCGFYGCVVVCCAYNSWVMEFLKNG
ncbi:hypothetical protein K2173_023040 [Erythroxylum novogranatense]|uniref:caffeate O-methyltransferase n=1 Tax=Erythroxylum novogranatense TaxID=1862640 RepID=A0AAV8T7Z1_9ROSI|nr:hypothetical protein K2173_023040 [Erythroxylum novogranatense]